MPAELKASARGSTAASTSSNVIDCCAGSWKRPSRSRWRRTARAATCGWQSRAAPSISSSATIACNAMHMARMRARGSGRARGRPPAPAPARQELHQPDQAEIPGAGGEVVHLPADRDHQHLVGGRAGQSRANQKRMNAGWRSSRIAQRRCAPCMRAEASRCTPGLPASVAASSAAATSSAAIGRMPRGTSGSTGRAAGLPTPRPAASAGRARGAVAEQQRGLERSRPPRSRARRRRPPSRP